MSHLIEPCMLRILGSNSADPGASKIDTAGCYPNHPILTTDGFGTKINSA